MGVKIPYLVTDSDGAIDDGGVCAWMVCCGTVQETIESTPLHWADYIHFGSGAIHLWLVDVSQGEKATQFVRAIEGHGMLEQSAMRKTWTNAYSCITGLVVQ